MMNAAINIDDMLSNLDEEDYKTVISFIEYLSAARKKERAEESKSILNEIQGIFSDNKGWNSEENMIEDMADFRRTRNGQ